MKYFILFILHYTGRPSEFEISFCFLVLDTVKLEPGLES